MIIGAATMSVVVAEGKGRGRRLSCGRGSWHAKRSEGYPLVKMYKVKTNFDRELKDKEKDGQFPDLN